MSFDIVLSLWHRYDPGIQADGEAFGDLQDKLTSRYPQVRHKETAVRCQVTERQKGYMAPIDKVEVESPSGIAHRY